MSEVNLSEWLRFFKGYIFHRYDYLVDPKSLVDVVDLYRRTFENVTSLDAKITANRTGSDRQRTLNANERNWQKVYDELRAGQIDTLVFGSIEPDITVSCHLKRLYEWLKGASEDELWRRPDEIAVSIEDRLLLDGKISVDLLQRLMEKTWKSLHGTYGLADMFVSHRKGLGSLRERAVAPQILRGFHFFLPPSIDYRSQVIGAYWLNFLNARHVATLGGPGQLEQKLKEQFPQPDIHLLPHEGLSVRISANPDYEDTETWERDHRKIRDILTPLIPPDPRV